MSDFRFLYETNKHVIKYSELDVIPVAKNNLKFGGFLKKSRKQLGLSRLSVAKYMGVSITTILKIENGNSKHIKYSYLKPMSKAYKIDYYELLYLSGIIHKDFISDIRYLSEINLNLKKTLELISANNLLVNQIDSETNNNGYVIVLLDIIKKYQKVARHSLDDINSSRLEK